MNQCDDKGAGSDPSLSPMTRGGRVAQQPDWVWLCGWFLAVNVPFLIGHPVWASAECPVLRSVAVNLVLFLAPGLAWFGIRTGRNWFGLLRLLGVIFVSFTVFLGTLGLFLLADWPMTASCAWNGTWFVSNLILIARLLVCRHSSDSGSATNFSTRAIRSPSKAPAAADSASIGVETKTRICAEQGSTRRLWLTGLAFFSIAYSLYYFGATQIVPAQVDHDLEVQGTGYALLHRIEPSLLTDRQTDYYFAHPPLLHYYVAASFLYFDETKHLKAFDDATLRYRTFQRGGSFAPYQGLVGEDRIVGRQGSDYVFTTPESELVRWPVRETELQIIYEHYLKSPHKLETRSPTIFLAALTVSLLAIWSLRFGIRWWMAVVAAVAYGTSPEVFVRSSYGGYFGITNFAALVLLWSAAEYDGESSRRQGAACFLAAAFAALANHKLLLLPVALGAATVLFPRPHHSKRRFVVRCAMHPALWGFLAGTAIFWFYGLSVNPSAFWEEHVRTHLIDRVAHVNPLGYTGYPSIRELWIEFSHHTGWLLLPLGCVGLVHLWVRTVRTGQSEWRTTAWAWCVWFSLTAVVFSIVDWRMTKHLMPLMLVLHAAPARCAADSRVWRCLAGPAFAFLIVSNCATLVELIVDFHAVTATPAW